MMALQEVCKKLEEDKSDHQRSILLADIMNAMGFSESEREIQRHRLSVQHIRDNNFHPTEKGTATLTGSTSEGMCGGIHSNQSHHDYDVVLIMKIMKHLFCRGR